MNWKKQICYFTFHLAIIPYTYFHGQACGTRYLTKIVARVFFTNTLVQVHLQQMRWLLVPKRNSNFLSSLQFVTMQSLKKVKNDWTTVRWVKENEKWMVLVLWTSHSDLMCLSHCSIWCLWVKSMGLWVLAHQRILAHPNVQRAKT